MTGARRVGHLPAPGKQLRSQAWCRQLLHWAPDTSRRTMPAVCGPPGEQAPFCVTARKQAT